nr:MAG TPA_asm: hypothetical protein [Caudoviricetes sp.]
MKRVNLRPPLRFLLEESGWNGDFKGPKRKP